MIHKTHKAKKITSGKYLYRGLEVTNEGYHHPDHCVWWEAVNPQTGEAEHHATTFKHIKDLIDEAEDR